MGQFGAPPDFRGTQVGHSGKDATMGTILLVDDDVAWTEACKLVVTQHGHEVRVAGSAEEARQLLRSGRPDAIVLDVMMERMTSGFDLAREVHKQFPDLPIILLTSLHQAVSHSLHFEPDEDWLPVTKFLDKPVEPEVLIKEIEGALAGKSLT
jgi:CheY-like chemotaxis protein